MENEKPPQLIFNDIKRIAEEFLSQYNQDDLIPVPIEEIAEFKLHIQIVPIPQLKSVFKIDGFINSTFDQITLDDEVFNRFEERARFTIAHEIGHKILHEKYFKHKKFTLIEEYIKFQETISSDNNYILERQANYFAGCVLVPGSRLRSEIDKAIKNKHKYSFLPPLEQLPELFKVSSTVIMIQIEKENIPINKLI